MGAVSEYGRRCGLAALAIKDVNNIEGALTAESVAFRSVMRLIYEWGE